MDMDIDLLIPAQVDQLNLMALDYDIPAGMFSKWVRIAKWSIDRQYNWSWKMIDLNIIDHEMINWS